MGDNGDTTELMFVIGYEPWLLPPVFEMTGALLERGCQVSVLYVGDTHTTESCVAGSLVRVRRRTGYLRALSPIDLSRRIRASARNTACRTTVVACDALALHAVRLARLRGDFRVGYWAFELEQASTGRSWSGTDFRRTRLHKWLRDVDFVIAPSASRLNRVRETSAGRIPGEVILNSRRSTARVDWGPDPLADSPLGKLAVRLAYTGRVSPVQHVERIIQSLAYMPNDVGLVVAGPGDDEYRHRLSLAAQACDAANRVAILGNLDRCAMDRVLAHCDIGFVLYDSAWGGEAADPAPNKLADYAYHGLAIVGSGQPYLRYWLQQRRLGICVDDFNPPSLARAVTTLRESEAFDRRRSTARAILADDLNMEVQASKLMQLLRTLNGPPGASNRTLGASRV